MGAYYLYDAGYTAAESWFYNQPYLFWQNAYWGDGLAAPFAQRPQLEYEVTGEQLQVMAEHEAGIAWLAAFQEGRLVQESTKGALELDLNEIDQKELLLVAQADIFEDRHDGLKVPAQMNASRPMGWSRIAPADWPELISEDSPEAQSCGCHATTKTTPPFPWFLGGVIWGWLRSCRKKTLCESPKAKKAFKWDLQRRGRSAGSGCKRHGQF